MFRVDVTEDIMQEIRKLMCTGVSENSDFGFIDENTIFIKNQSIKVALTNTDTGHSVFVSVADLYKSDIKSLNPDGIFIVNNYYKLDNLMHPVLFIVDFNRLHCLPSYTYHNIMTIPVSEYTPRDTVAKIKKKIENTEGYVIFNKFLYFNGKKVIRNKLDFGTYYDVKMLNIYNNILILFDLGHHYLKTYESGVLTSKIQSLYGSV